MQGNGFTVPIRIVPQGSVRLRQALILGHLALAALVLLACRSPLYGVCLLLACGLHYRHWQRELAADCARFAAVLFDSEGRWWLQAGAGKRIPAQLSTRLIITPWLMVLPLLAPGGARGIRLYLLRDNLPSDDFRRLRVRLLWQASNERL